MTTAITVVRHGESELSVRGICNGDPGVPCRLAPSGVLQAQELAERLEGEPFRQLLCLQHT